MKKCVLLLVLGASLAHADSYRLETSSGVKTFDSKPEAVRFILLNEGKVSKITESRDVELTEKLSFKKVKAPKVARK